MERDRRRTARRLSWWVLLSLRRRPARSGAATSTTGSIAVTYTAAANNGAPFTNFTATCISANGGAAASGAHVGSTVAKIVVAGATTAKDLHLPAVTATNSRGTSPASSSSLPVIVGTPIAPGLRRR